MIDPNSILNDPNFTPLSADSTVFVTEDGTFIIVSSTLPARFNGTRYGKTKSWLKTPRRYVKGKKR